MHNQKGITLIGMLFAAVAVICVGIFVMRVVPVYLQHYAIVQSIKDLGTIADSSLTGDNMSDAMALRRSLTKRLDINGINDLSDEELSITPDGENKYIVKLKYQATRPLVYNMSLLFQFDDVIEVKTHSEN
ncbi:MAG: DUF4845 domain-containing protein [Legionella sp.]